MKVLILSATIGQGHNSCANAIAKGFSSLGIESKVLDMYGYISPNLKKMISQGYLFNINFFSKQPNRTFANIGYESLEKYTDRQSKFSLLQQTHILIAKEILPYIEEYMPDIIISTQVNCVNVLNYLKKKKLISMPVIGVVTDYTIQSLWKYSTEIDFIVTPHRNLQYQLIKRGVHPKKILPLGIPVESRFSQSSSLYAAKLKLKFSPYKPVVFISSGSMGYHKIDKMITEIDHLPLPFQLVVICGNNKELYEKVCKIPFHHSARIYRYTKHIPLLLDASDVVITKPGGVSVSEILAKGKAMILSNPIPGMEEKNLEFLSSHGVGFDASGSIKPVEALFTLLLDKKLKKQLEQQALSFGKPNSTTDLIKHCVIQYDKKKLKHI